ncbi:hypothetical protein [Micromonospora sp. NPDC047074]|uniref:hypothetical protein n=1 Tax=Micromonospora sp. NPDC047074 TaxID=3154339 RepID=UPI0034008979
MTNMVPSGRRAGDLGVVVGPLPTGRHNPITDVAGVLMGRAVSAALPAWIGPQFFSDTHVKGAPTTPTGDRAPRPGQPTCRRRAGNHRSRRSRAEGVPG